MQILMNSRGGCRGNNVGDDSGARVRSAGPGGDVRLQLPQQRASEPRVQRGAGRLGGRRRGRRGSALPARPRSLPRGRQTAQERGHQAQPALHHLHGAQPGWPPGRIHFLLGLPIRSQKISLWWGQYVVCLRRVVLLALVHHFHLSTAHTHFFSPLPSSIGEFIGSRPSGARRAPQLLALAGGLIYTVLFTLFAVNGSSG